MQKYFRPLGILLCGIGTILFLAGTLTDHWVISDNGHWGLWEVCDYSGNFSSTANTTMKTTLSPANALPPKFDHGDDDDDDSEENDNDDDDDDDDDDDKDDDDENCEAHGILSIPAFLHIVRILVILASGVFVWGILSGRTLHRAIRHSGSLVETHKAEILGIIAALGVVISLVLFSKNFKSHYEDRFPKPRLGWSYFLVEVSLPFYFPAAILMMAPTIRLKYSEGCHSIFPDFGDYFRTLCIRFGFKKRGEIPSRNEGHAHQRRGSLVITTHNVDGNNHDASFQLSEVDSDVFTVTIVGDEDLDNDPEGHVAYRSAMNDLPQYEDLVPVPWQPAPPPLPPPGSSFQAPPDPGLPPPPSYDEVVAGGYLAFSTSSPGIGTTTTTTIPPAAESRGDVDRSHRYDSMA